LHNHHQNALKPCLMTISVFRWNSCGLWKCLNTYHASSLRLKSSSLHVSLCRNISGGNCTESYPSPNRFGKSSRLQWKKLFWFWVFCEWCHKWSCFRPFWSTSSGPRPKPPDGSISLKFLLETRLKSGSFDSLIDLLRFLVQKLWYKICKVINLIIR